MPNPPNINFAKANMVFGYVSREPELFEKMSEATEVIEKKNGEQYLFPPEIIEVVNRLHAAGKDVSNYTKSDILDMTKEVLGMGDGAEAQEPAEEPAEEPTPAEEAPAEEPAEEPAEAPAEEIVEEEIIPPPPKPVVKPKAPAAPAPRAAAPVTPRPAAPAAPAAPATPKVAAKPSVATPAVAKAPGPVTPKPAPAVAPVAKAPVAKAPIAKAPAAKPTVVAKTVVEQVGDETETVKKYSLKEASPILVTFTLLAAASNVAEKDETDGAPDRLKRLQEVLADYQELLD